MKNKGVFTVLIKDAKYKIVYIEKGKELLRLSPTKEGKSTTPPPFVNSASAPVPL